MKTISSKPVGFLLASLAVCLEASLGAAERGPQPLSPRRDKPALKREWTRPPTKEAGPVDWKGDKIVSRVLPYPDFTSLFIRLPIAHAAATGQGVKVAVLQLKEDSTVPTLIQNVAPHAEIISLTCETDGLGEDQLKLFKAGCRIAVVANPPQWPETAMLQLARQLAVHDACLVIAADLSEQTAAIDLVNKLHALGALTVGRVNRQSLVMTGAGGDNQPARPFNRHIRALQTDLFSSVDPDSELDAGPVATAAAVAALVLEKWPTLSPAELRRKLIAGGRTVWQSTSIESGKWQTDIEVDPITTRYAPKDEQSVFRFRVLDAAGALGVDTEIPWFLNLLNCQKAWEITKGEGALVVVSDQGFHIKHPDLVSHIQATEHFGWLTFEASEQNFHGTDMSRILLAVAPEVRLVPILCSGYSSQAGGDLATNIARSFRRAAELKADAISASWAGWFSADEKLQAAVRDAVDGGVVVSWFHYPHAYPGVLRSRFTYFGWGEAHLGFADRFLTDPPGFHPVEIEAGLSGTAPQAAGIAALVRSVNPKLTPPQVEELVVQNATPIGHGVLIPDVYKTLLAAGGHE